MIIRQFITGLLGIWILGTNAVVSFYSPQHVMVDVTNDFGVCVLQMISSKKENIAFSPYGLVSVALVLYEGSTGPSAAEIHNTLRLPWDREVTRVGFRDMHRYLKSYFSNDGFLRGLVLSKPNIMLRKNYTDLLQFYGFDVRTSPPRVPPSAPVPTVLTTGKPASSPPLTTTTKPPVTTTEPEITTRPSNGSRDLEGRFGTTTTEMSKPQTTLTTLKAPETTIVPQTNTPALTTPEKTTKSVVTTLPTTTKPPAPTTTGPPPPTTITTTAPTTTKPPPTTIKTTAPTTTKPPSTTTTPPPTTTLPPTTKPPPPQTTTTVPPTTKAAPPTTTTTPVPTTTKAPTTKSADSTQSGTTLDVITMTDKRPNTPEIMSQVNMSATGVTEMTTGGRDLMEGREGDSDMDLETTKLDITTTSRPTTTEMKSSPHPEETTGPPEQATTLETSNTVEISIAETTVSKSVSMVDPNTTPIPPTLPQETTPKSEKSETDARTLIIETTTPLATTGEDATAAASESIIDQGTTIMLPEETVPPEGIPDATNEDSEANPTGSTPPVVFSTPGVIQVPAKSPTLLPGTLPPVVTAGPPISTGTAPPIPVVPAAPPIGTTPGVILQVPTESPPSLPGTLPPVVTAGTVPPVTVVPAVPPIGAATETIAPNPTATETVPLLIVSTETIPATPTIDVATETVPPIAVATEPPTPVVPLEQTTQPTAILLQSNEEAAMKELMDSEASESRAAEALARQQRSLFSTLKTPERYHKSGSNWVPHYQDHRWGQNPSNEFWFFTFTGGESVPAHTYTAYLPFAFVPELSSLALQLPLDDPRYSILILLPEERLGLSQLLYSLQWCPVRAILTHLKMTAVYAVVPAFTIVKHINLVPALAKMGIHSVFDPFRGDLSPMTTEPHLFVRTIEQVVTVSLRKYYASNRWFEASPNEVRQHFVANHPFAYFVLDKETGVTLMAGTIVNPVAHNQ